MKQLEIAPGDEILIICNGKRVTGFVAEFHQTATVSIVRGGSGGAVGGGEHWLFPFATGPGGEHSGQNPHGNS